MSEESWFKPKRNGYGSGPPIRWQGWAVLIGYVALMAATPRLITHSPAPGILVALAATAAFCLIAARTTKGGWRWRRNGKPE